MNQTKDYTYMLLDFIEKFEENHKQERSVYFSGEFDCNQTKFEYLSNHTRIGVISNYKYCGTSLLFLLRMIIDRNPKLFKMCIDEILNNKNAIVEDDFDNDTESEDTSINEDHDEEFDGDDNFKRILRCVSLKETAYLSSFNYDDNYGVDLKGNDVGYENHKYDKDEEIDKNINLIWKRKKISTKKNTDLWTCQRVKEYFDNHPDFFN